ncbi:MAG: hypothetical protein WB297_09305 [Actinomycetota bacterium]
MSTRVGTLQAPRAGGSILLATFLASLVVLTSAVVAISLDREGRQGETTFVGRHVVNTPSELSAGTVGGVEQTFVGGTAANTPSELKPVYMHGRNLLGLSPLEPVYMHGRNLLGLSPLNANTPTELSGGVIGDGLPAEIYDRHQRG